MTEHLTEAAKLHAAKLRHYRFKNTARYDSVEAMQTAITTGGSTFQLRSATSRIVSDVIDGNCVVLERDYRHKTPTFTELVAFFVGATGHVEHIKAGYDHNGSLDELVGWLTGPVFRRDKLELLAQNTLPLHESIDEPLLRVLVDDNPEHPLYQDYLAFYAALEAFEATLPTETNPHTGA